MANPSEEWRLQNRQGLSVNSDSVSDIDNFSDDSEDTMFTSCISNIYPCVDSTNTPPQGDSHTNPASSGVSMCSLDCIVTSFKNQFNEFQNCFSESWTMRETNFCQKTLSNMSDIVEKMEEFNQKYHQFVTNFNWHMQEILWLNVESLLLSMKAFIRCCGSLQYSKHSSGVALYPEELIQIMRLSIEQSLKAVNTAWVTFLQSTNCQIEEFPIDHTWPQNLASVSTTDFEQNVTMAETMHEKNEASPNRNVRKELFNEETTLKEPDSDVAFKYMSNENARALRDMIRDTSRASQKEKLRLQNLQSMQDKELAENIPGEGDCSNKRPTFAVKECSVPLEKCDVSQKYTPKHTPSIQEGTVLNHTWDGVAPEIHDQTQQENKNFTHQGLQNTEKTHSLPKIKEKRISNISLANSESKPKTARRKKKPGSKIPAESPTPESLSMESPLTPCTDRGTQTPSKLSALQINPPTTPERNAILQNKNLRKKRNSKSPSENLDKSENKSRELEQSQTKSSFNHKKKTEYKDDYNPSSKKEKLLLNQDHPLTTFVSSLRSYQRSPTSMHVSLQVACVERKVLARRLRIEEAKSQLEKKKSRHRSRKRPMDTRRSEKPDVSNEIKSMKSLDEKTSSTPWKRVKKTDDIVHKNNSNDTNSVSNSSYLCAHDQQRKAEKDNNNNTSKLDAQNSSNLVTVNQQQCEPIKSQVDYVNTGPKQQSTVRQIVPLMLLKDEDQFFLNQQADLTARIKSRRKMKTSSGVNPLSSTPNHPSDQAANQIRKQPQKHSDRNNNVWSS